MSALKMYYENITTYQQGELYCGITMKWDYTKSYVDISIPGYVKEYFHQSGHKTPKNPQHQPYPTPKQTYGADAQKMKLVDTSKSLSTQGVKS